MQKSVLLWILGSAKRKNGVKTGLRCYELQHLPAKVLQGVVGVAVGLVEVAHNLPQQLGGVLFNGAGHVGFEEVAQRVAHDLIASHAQPVC